MGQALYRKYRPKNLDEAIGQEHITATLKNALKTGKISHAYLFTGPHGVGKTSVARILAHEVNGLDYDEDQHRLDIIEIDAASNRRIDEIRDLRDKVHIAPTHSKFKVYIIDEVHMLTKEAFNALLKTLEEPPNHVIFILATTEAYKLPQTIISRTQRFSFKPIEVTQIKQHLKNIAKKEKIQFDDTAIDLIAEHSEGSFRDSISLLDQASSSGHKLSLDNVQQLLGIAPQQIISKLLGSLYSASANELIDSLNQLKEQGYGAASIAKQLSQTLRQQLIEDKARLGSATTIQLLKDLIDIPASVQPESLLELTLLNIILSADTKQAMSKEPNPLEDKPAAESPIPKKQQTKNQSTNLESSETSQIFTLELWPKVLATVKSRHNTLYSIMRMGRPILDGQTLTLSFKFAFHQKQINDTKNRKIIDEIIKHHSSQPIKIVSVIDPSIKVDKNEVSEVSDSADLTTISNIFGSAEVLDS